MMVRLQGKFDKSLSVSVPTNRANICDVASPPKSQMHQRVHHSVPLFPPILFQRQIIVFSRQNSVFASCKLYT